MTNRYIFLIDNEYVIADSLVNAISLWKEHEDKSSDPHRTKKISSYFIDSERMVEVRKTWEENSKREIDQR